MYKKLFKAISITLVISTLLNFLPIAFLKTVSDLKRIIKVNEIYTYNSYENYFDNINIESDSNYVYQIEVTKKIDKNLLSEVQFTNTVEINDDIIETIDDEQLSVETEVVYNPMSESMNMDLTIADSEGNAATIDVVAKPHINEDGSVSGKVYIDGEKYEIEEILEIAENDEIDENSLSLLVICGIVGAIIGATIGGIGAYNLAKAQKKSTGGTVVYVVGGIIIGGVIGSLLGIKAGQLGSVIFAKMATLGTKLTIKNGYNSFYLLKKAIGSSVAGQQFHHLVSQGYGNVERFGNQIIHNTQNIVQISDKLHKAITSVYNAKEGMKYGGETFGQFMSKQNLEEQYRVAIETMNRLASELGEVVKYF